MGLLPILVLSSIIAIPQEKTSFGSTPSEAVRQANAIAEKLLTRTERSAAFLAIAQAQIKLGDKQSAMISLDTGWISYTTGSNKKFSEGDRFDSFTLFDESDESMLPVKYAVEFLVAGSLEKAKMAADSLGESPLGKSYREGLGHQIRTQFPDAFEVIAFTDSDRERRVKRKQTLLEQAEKLDEEADISKRAFLLSQIADELGLTNGKKEAIETLHKSLALAPQISNTTWRTIFLSQASNSFWNLAQKEEAKSILQQAIELDKTLTGDPKEVLRAHFSVEQTKRSLGMPDNLGQVMKEMDKAAGVIPTQPNSAPGPIRISPISSTMNISDIIGKAGELKMAGDLKGAQSLLRKITPQTPDSVGWWHVLAGEMQIEFGDKTLARQNLAEGSRRFIASLTPAESLPGEQITQLERVSRAQALAGDDVAASATIAKGFQKLVAGPDTKKMLHIGDGGNHMVLHDRTSPILHKGALAFAEVGDFPSALAMARSIKGTAHRAIALAGIVRDLNKAKNQTK